MTSVHHASRYYAQRRKMTGKNGRTRRVSYRRHPKLGLVCDAASHFILAARASQGPRPDFGEFEPLVREAQARANLAAIAADAGFDSEAVISTSSLSEGFAAAAGGSGSALRAAVV